MSEDMQTYPRFAYKSFGDILSDGFVLFARNWLKIIVPFAFFSIIAIIIKNFLLPDLIWSYNLLFPQVEAILDKAALDLNSITNADMQILVRFLALFVGSLFLDRVIGALFTVLAMCSVSSYLLKRYKGIDTDFFKEFKSYFNSKLFIVLLFIGILVPLGWFCLFIPGIIFFKLHIFSVFTYRNETEKQTLKEARSIAKGQFWKIICIYFIPAFIIFLINFVFSEFILAIFFPANLSWYDPITRNYGMIILYDLINQLFTILIGPLFICFLTTFYTSLKAKKSILLQFEREPTRITYPYSESIESETNKFKSPYQTSKQKFESGLYCPFCGKFMEKKFERCPFCNESLDFEF